ncbi:hypothetical protein JRO89_XS02G0017800 [Xanthoceras sorbifolium]|uniref:CDP-diacylglycerol--inositol 3-phosphatidyltransferase n=1 Tax=Xanthoceras sorbifolium TaxID=99658 RepID=A0ABQ8IE36_9ROSI|nr:hypothetical protein JRO89_XS02G0017800 [Xanthoceras sorbifolium]
MANTSKSRPKKQGKLSVYLYIPNIIGYIRVLLNCYAFAVCFSQKWVFSILYFVSFVCDAVDGWCARKFNQGTTLSIFIRCKLTIQLKALLPIEPVNCQPLELFLTWISTACLLVILSQVYRPGLVFVSLLALDIASHWLQMYSTFLVGKTSHKDVKDSSSWLFRLYYGNRMFMGFCCVACEVLYITLFLIVESQNENLADVLVSSLQQGSPLSFLLALSLFGWAIKQIINFIQMKTAADACVLYDIEKKQKR